MYNQYNLEANNSLEKIVKNFKTFLYSEDISKGSIRSYLSDLRHFLGWFFFFLESNRLLKLKDLINPQEGLTINNFCFCLKKINPKVLDAYKNFLIENNIPPKTINRRLSSLRRFGAFCQTQNWLSENVFESLKNVSLNQKLPEEKYFLEEFKTSLWQKGASSSTIKNYLNDVKQFIAWHKKENQ